MKKILVIGILPLVMGIIAGILRAYELAFSFDFVSGLPKGALWITPVILIVGVILLVASIALTVKREFPPSEEKKSVSQMAVSFFGCAIMLALGGYVFFVNHVQAETINLIFAAICLIAAFSFALLGTKNLQNNENGLYSFMALFPVLWACVALILVFRDRIADPIIADYIHLVFAYIAILMFTYAQSGYVYRKNKLWVLFTSTILGIYFCVIELVSPFVAALFNAEYALNLDFTVLLPMLLFAIYMPISTSFMLKNQNDVK